MNSLTFIELKFAADVRLIPTIYTKACNKIYNCLYIFIKYCLGSWIVAPNRPTSFL